MLSYPISQLMENKLVIMHEMPNKMRTSYQIPFINLAIYIGHYKPITDMKFVTKFQSDSTKP